MNFLRRFKATQSKKGIEDTIEAKGKLILKVALQSKKGVAVESDESESEKSRDTFNSSTSRPMSTTEEGNHFKELPGPARQNKKGVAVESDEGESEDSPDTFSPSTSTTDNKRDKKRDNKRLLVSNVSCTGPPIAFYHFSHLLFICLISIYLLSSTVRLYRGQQDAERNFQHRRKSQICPSAKKEWKKSWHRNRKNGNPGRSG